MLLYGTGGFTYGRIATNLNGGTVTNSRTGWAAGAGLEYGFTHNRSAKLEWIYVNFGSYQWTNATNANFACTGLNCSTERIFRRQSPGPHARGFRFYAASTPGNRNA